MNIKDNSNKNILHYLSMSSENLIISKILLSTFNKSYDTLLGEQDVDGRTPLHYAALSGKYIWEDIDYWTISFNPMHYMIRDKNNRTVLDLLFTSMPSLQPKFGKLDVRTHYNCDLTDLFKIPGCADIRYEILDNFENFAFQAFSNLKDTNLLHKRNIFNFMQGALKKNRFYLLFMIKVFLVICTDQLSN